MSLNLDYGPWSCGWMTDFGSNAQDLWVTPNLRPWKEDFLSTSMREDPMAIPGGRVGTAYRTSPARNLDRDIPTTVYR